MAEELQHYIMAGNFTADSDRVATYTNTSGERQFLRGIVWNCSVSDATENSCMAELSYSQVSTLSNQILTAANGQRDKVIDYFPFNNDSGSQAALQNMSAATRIFPKGQYVIEENESIYLHVASVATADSGCVGCLIKFHD